MRGVFGLKNLITTKVGLLLFHFGFDILSFLDIERSSKSDLGSSKVSEALHTPVH